MTRRFFIMMPTTFTIVVAVLISLLLLTGSAKAQNSSLRKYNDDKNKTPVVKVSVGTTAESHSHYDSMSRRNQKKKQRPKRDQEIDWIISHFYGKKGGKGMGKGTKAKGRKSKGTKAKGRKSKGGKNKHGNMSGKGKGAAPISFPPFIAPAFPAPFVAPAFPPFVAPFIGPPVDSPIFLPPVDSPIFFPTEDTPTPTGIDSAGNCYGVFSGEVDQTDRPPYNVTISYTSAGIVSTFSFPQGNSCGNTVPTVPNVVRKGRLEWFDVIDFDVGTLCTTNGTVRLTEQIGGGIWDYFLSTQDAEVSGPLTVECSVV
jgi:hypothetical protein